MRPGSAADRRAADLVAAHGLVEADRERIGIPLHAGGPQLGGDAHRVLEQEPSQPGADHRGLQPQVLQLGPFTVAGDSMPAHGDAIQVEHPDFLRGHVLGFQLQHRLHHRQELRRVRPMGLGPMRQRPQRRRLLRFGAPDGRRHAPRRDGRSMAGQRSMTTSRPAAAARSAAVLVPHVELQPDRLGADGDRLVDVGSGPMRGAEDVDHLDRAVRRTLRRRGGEVGHGGDAVDGGLARVDGDHLVAVAHQRARHPVAGAASGLASSRPRPRRASTRGSGAPPPGRSSGRAGSVIASAPAPGARP